jgi:hypothetical protein
VRPPSCHVSLAISSDPGSLDHSGVVAQPAVQTRQSTSASQRVASSHKRRSAVCRHPSIDSSSSCWSAVLVAEELLCWLTLKFQCNHQLPFVMLPRVPPHRSAARCPHSFLRAQRKKTVLAARSCQAAQGRKLRRCTSFGDPQSCAQYVAQCSVDRPSRETQLGRAGSMEACWVLTRCRAAAAEPHATAAVGTRAGCAGEDSMAVLLPGAAGVVSGRLTQQRRSSSTICLPADRLLPRQHVSRR